MGKITPQPREKVIRALTRAYDWRFDREGSRHTVFVKDGVPEVISIPRHSEISPGVIKNICKILGVKTDDFLQTLRNC